MFGRKEAAGFIHRFENDIKMFLIVEMSAYTCGDLRPVHMKASVRHQTETGPLFFMNNSYDHIVTLYYLPLSGKSK